MPATRECRGLVARAPRVKPGQYDASIELLVLNAEVGECQIPHQGH